jgi:hypothetical protein
MVTITMTAQVGLVSLHGASKSITQIALGHRCAETVQKIESCGVGDA